MISTANDKGPPGDTVVKKKKKFTCQCRRYRTRDVDLPRVRKIPWKRKRQPTLVFLPGKFHEQRRLVGPCGRKESDITKHACRSGRQASDKSVGGRVSKETKEWSGDKKNQVES